MKGETRFVLFQDLMRAEFFFFIRGHFGFIFFFVKDGKFRMELCSQYMRVSFMLNGFNHFAVECKSGGFDTAAQFTDSLVVGAENVWVVVFCET